MYKALGLFLSLWTASSVAMVDSRFTENATFMTKSSMLRFQYLSLIGNECTAGNPTKLISRIPFYTYVPATNATQVTPGKYAAVIFLHGLNEQGGSVPNMCYPRTDAEYATMSTNLILVENTAGGPGAAILNGLFKPAENMVVIIPQSMKAGGFSADAIRTVIEDATQQLATKGIEFDADRFYLTGLSMGGGSALHYIADYPDHFAAVVPIEAGSGIDPCLVQNHSIAFWGFAGGASGNMYLSNLTDTIYGNSTCPESTIEYTNATYTCKFNNKSCTMLSASHPAQLRATFMPTDGHSGWTSVYNGTHSALPTTEKNIYNWMLSHRNSDLAKPLFPVAYRNGISLSSSSIKSSVPTTSASSVITSSSVSSSTVSNSTVSSSKISSSVVSSTLTSSSIKSSAASSVVSSVNSSSIAINNHRILLSPSMIMSGAPGNPQALVDEQLAVGDPLITAGTKPLTNWDVWGTAFPVSAVIDLGKDYDITDILLYDSNGISNIEIAAGTLDHFDAPVVVDGLELYEAWKKYKVHVTTRYLRVTKYGAAAMRELVIYGQATAVAPPTPPESKPIDLTNASILPGAVGNAQALIDEQTSTAPTTYWFAGWQTQYPVEAIIDLGKEYTITDISLYDAQATGQVEISDGDLSHAQTPIITDQLLNYLRFNPYSVNITTRYLRVKKFNSAGLNEITLKGY